MGKKPAELPRRKEAKIGKEKKKIGEKKIGFGVGDGGAGVPAPGG